MLEEFDYESREHSCWTWKNLINFSYGDHELGTAQWAEELMEYLGMTHQEDSKQEEEEEGVDAPFRVRISDTETMNLDQIPQVRDQGRARPLRQRIVGIRRKTLVEVKTSVLEQMAREEPTIQRQINRDITRAIFVEKKSVSVLRPKELEYKYYEMNDLQFNLYSARVKEETEKDRLRVSTEKQTMLEEMNRINTVRVSSTTMILGQDMIDKELIPVVLNFRFEELPCDLPPPQLASPQPHSTSNVSGDYPHHFTSSSDPRVSMTNEGTLQGILRVEDEDEREEERIESKENIENQPRTGELIIEEPELSREAERITDRNRDRTGPITRVIIKLI